MKDSVTVFEHADRTLRSMFCILYIFFILFIFKLISFQFCLGTEVF